MTDPYLLRKAGIQDLGAITELFRETILYVNARDYDPDQIIAWSAGAGNTSRWHDRIMLQYFLLAFDSDTLVGFASITPEGYLDTMYVQQHYQQKGVGQCLYQAIESYARASGLQQISSDVSITARPFFERKGFVVQAAQDVALRGQVLRNFKMVKSLGL